MEVMLRVEEEGSGRTATHEVEIDDGATVRDALQAAGINPETVIVEQDGQVITMQDEIDEDELRVLQVVSGG